MGTKSGWVLKKKNACAFIIAQNPFKKYGVIVCLIQHSILAKCTAKGYVSWLRFCWKSYKTCIKVKWQIDAVFIALFVVPLWLPRRQWNTYKDTLSPPGPMSIG